MYRYCLARLDITNNYLLPFRPAGPFLALGLLTFFRFSTAPFPSLSARPFFHPDDFCSRLSALESSFFLSLLLSLPAPFFFIASRTPLSSARPNSLAFFLSSCVSNHVRFGREWISSS